MPLMTDLADALLQVARELDDYASAAAEEIRSP